MDAKAAAYNLLGVALQTVGETNTARQAYLLSAKLHIDPTDNPAVKRLFFWTNLTLFINFHLSYYFNIACTRDTGE